MKHVLWSKTISEGKMDPKGHLVSYVKPLPKEGDKECKKDSKCEVLCFVLNHLIISLVSSSESSCLRATKGWDLFSINFSNPFLSPLQYDFSNMAASHWFPYAYSLLAIQHARQCLVLVFQVFECVCFGFFSFVFHWHFFSLMSQTSWWF